MGRSRPRCGLLLGHEGGRSYRSCAAQARAKPARELLRSLLGSCCSERQRWAAASSSAGASAGLLGIQACGTAGDPGPQVPWQRRPPAGLDTLRRGPIWGIVLGMGDELVVSVCAYLAEHDPDVLAAIGDVDRSLIQAELRRSPLERLVASVQQARFYDRLAAARQTAPSSPR